MKEYEKVCGVCGKQFVAHSKTAKYCSDECKYEMMKKNAINYKRRKKKNKLVEMGVYPLKCIVCGTEITSGKGWKYCSRECYLTMQKEYKRVYSKKRPYRYDVGIRFDGNEIFEDETERKKKRPKVKSISEICKEAKEHGMNYGEYVTWLEMNK